MRECFKNSLIIKTIIRRTKFGCHLGDSLKKSWVVTKYGMTWAELGFEILKDTWILPVNQDLVHGDN